MLKEDGSLKGSLKVIAKYVPAITIDASVEGSVNRHKDEATKVATNFSQDVTERTVKKITEQIWLVSLSVKIVPSVRVVVVCVRCMLSPLSTFSTCAMSAA